MMFSVFFLILSEGVAVCDVVLRTCARSRVRVQQRSKVALFTHTGDGAVVLGPAVSRTWQTLLLLGRHLVRTWWTCCKEINKKKQTRFKIDSFITGFAVTLSFVSVFTVNTLIRVNYWLI